MYKLIASNLFIFHIVSCGNAPATKSGEESKHSVDYRPNLELVENCTSAEESALINQLNNIRNAAGAPAAVCHTKLTKMTLLRSSYLTQNPQVALSHFEDKRLKGFKGRTLRERGDKSGIDNQNFWLSEGLGGGLQWPDVLAAHINSVYHRSPLLTPSLKFVSYAPQVISSMASIAVEDLEPAMYPSPDETIDQVEFLPGFETPNPWPAKLKTGTPISVHFPRVYIKRKLRKQKSQGVKVEKFSVYFENMALEGKIIATASDSQVEESDVFFIPSKPLKRGTKYSVRVNLRYEKRSFIKNWSFTTKN